jgi:DNA ligase-1
MKQFASLLTDLEGTTSTIGKVARLVSYFQEEEEESNRLWALALLLGKRPQRPVSTTLLREWCAELAGIPLWLFEQNYHVVGDLAESIALILPPAQASMDKVLHQYVEELILLRQKSDEEKKEYLCAAWQGLDRHQKWAFNKIITGGFRIGVSRNLIIQALAQATSTPSNVVAHRLMGSWHPSTTRWHELLGGEQEGDVSRPYPFYLAYALPAGDESTISPAEWAAEWKWDGIRCQWIYRQDQHFLWSRGEELMTDKFPELTAGTALPYEFVLDGEVVAWADGRPMEFQRLQTRIGRKNPGKKILQDTPVHFIAYDMLECNGADLRHLPFRERRQQLEDLISKNAISSVELSPLISFDDAISLADLRRQSRACFAEGLMLKRWSSPYHTGRKSGDMWKWKTDPYTIDAVMLYAQRGHGRRANLFSDFTFALWQEGRLVPFAKAYSGLTDVEMQEVTAFVKANTLETFGPVHSVRPELVFELAFEGISLSGRHKSGLAVRFPRIVRWRKDKPADQADRLDTLKEWVGQVS